MWVWLESLKDGFIGFAICVVCAGAWWLYEENKDEEERTRSSEKYMEEKRLTAFNEALPSAPVLFDESRIITDLQRIRDNTSLVGQYFAVLRSRFTSQREISIINQWAAQCNAGEQLILAKTGMMRAANEYRGLERENLQKSAETESTIAKHLADKEEHVSRAEKAKADRQLYNMEVEARLYTAKNPPQPESQPSPKQLRAKEKRACEARIKKLKAEKANGLEIEDEQERILRGNAIDDALQREMERWAKLL